MIQMAPVGAAFLLPEFIRDLANFFVGLWLNDRFAHSRHGFFCRAGQFGPALLDARLNLLPSVLARGGNVLEDFFRFDAFVM
jgi:hypothetical protein